MKKLLVLYIPLGFEPQEVKIIDQNPAARIEELIGCEHVTGISIFYGRYIVLYQEGAEINPVAINMSIDGKFFYGNVIITKANYEGIFESLNDTEIEVLKININLFSLGG